MELSLEFFPPKTEEGAAKLRSVREQLSRALKPTFISVTFGAGGSTQDGTLSTVKEIHEAGQEAAPHLSCVGSSKEKIRELLKQYKQIGIRRIVALRGDLPSGMGQYGEFHHAEELVRFIRSETDSHFHIEVAAYPEMHPQAKSMSDDILMFANKMKAGADSAITQYFFNSDAYFRFVDEAYKLGVDQPIVLASCQSPTVLSCYASQMLVVQRFLAGFVCVYSHLVTILHPSSHLVWMW